MICTSVCEWPWLWVCSHKANISKWKTLLSLHPRFTNPTCEARYMSIILFAHMMLAYIILYDFSFTNMQLSYVCKHTSGYVYFWIKFPCPVWNTSCRSSLDAGTWVWKHVSPATIFTYNLNAMCSHRHSQRHPLGHIHYSNLGNWCTRSCVWQAGRQARSLHCHTAGWGNALGCQGPSGNYSTRKLTAGRAPVERMTW